MISEIEKHQGAVAFVGNLTAMLGVLILGFPLTPRS